MTYKGYSAALEVDEGSEEIHGRVLGINGTVTFHAPTVAEAREEFAKSVEAHLALLARQGLPAERPFSGKFLVRLDADQHRDLADFATVHSLSLNESVRLAVGRLLDSQGVGESRAASPDPLSMPKGARRRSVGTSAAK